MLHLCLLKHTKKYQVNQLIRDTYFDLTNFLEEFLVIRFLIEMHSSTSNSAGKPLGIGDQSCDVRRASTRRQCIRITGQSVAMETILK